MRTRSLLGITPQVVLAAAVILFGVLLTLDNLDVVDSGKYFRFWPVILILVGLIGLAQPAGNSGRLTGLFVACFGGLLLANNLGVLRFRVWDLWPLFLVVAGGNLLRQAWRPNRKVLADSGSTVSGFATMGGFHRNCSSQNFQGGELTVVMGGCHIDLREASIQDNPAVFNIFTFMGGIEIRVPEDWMVTLNVSPFMGGYEDKTRQPKEGSGKELVIRGVAMMGGVEVKN